MQESSKQSRPPFERTNHHLLSPRTDFKKEPQYRLTGLQTKTAEQKQTSPIPQRTFLNFSADKTTDYIQQTKCLPTRSGRRLRGFLSLYSQHSIRLSRSIIATLHYRSGGFLSLNFKDTIDYIQQTAFFSSFSSSSSHKKLVCLCMSG